MTAKLTEAWYQFPARRSPLEPLGWLYGALSALRRRAYAAGVLQAWRAPCPVIVVGNLTVGGTGKTPLTLWLAGALRARGLAAGILSRGYGRTGTAVAVVEPGSDWRAVGDEPLLLRRRSGCPTVVAADRRAGARALLELGARVILCDDGLQHLRLARDLEVVVIDGARGFGNGRLLPAGPLREPPARLGRAELAVVNGPPTHPSLAGAGPLLQMDLALGEAHALGGAGRRPLEAFREAPVHAVAGIGNPQRFFAALRSRGLTLTEHAFADHHPFSAADLAFGDGRAVLMTEKDAVKCTPFAAPHLWYVPAQAQFAPEAARTLLGRVAIAVGDPGVAGS